ncbi:hypothetical protein EZS27_022148 [termite gut metagenome]|uniref:Uncharacterized protein n=1 Tax=termite gut metagenome TaxID=433724 RepID=A0A5J4R8J3_9ZZZZ
MSANELSTLLNIGKINALRMKYVLCRMFFYSICLEFIKNMYFCKRYYNSMTILNTSDNLSLYVLHVSSVVVVPSRT